MCCKGAVSMLVGLTMRSYWLGSICFACLHYLLAYMLVRFALIFVTLLALTAGHRFDGLLALLSWVLIRLAHEDNCYKRAVSLLVGLTMRSYWLGSTCFACSLRF